MINNINKLPETQFIKLFANIFENSQFIAEDLYRKKGEGFNDFEDLIKKMMDIFDNTTKGQKLKRHTDRPSCEVSITACISQTEQWPIHVNNKWYKLKHKAIKNISKSIYALPELCKNYLKKYKIIACPGCYPTSILLPLLPLFKKNLIFHKNIIIDSKSGYSGAGRGIHKRTTKKKLHESLSAYGVGFHRHNSEIDQELSKIKNNISFIFTPHLSPMFRGILSTIYIDLKDNIIP